MLSSDLCEFIVEDFLAVLVLFLFRKVGLCEVLELTILLGKVCSESSDFLLQVAGAFFGAFYYANRS